MKDRILAVIIHFVIVMAVVLFMAAAARWAHSVKAADDIIGTYANMALITVGVFQLAVPPLTKAWLHPDRALANASKVYNILINWKSEWVVLGVVPLTFTLLGCGLATVYFLLLKGRT